MYPFLIGWISNALCDWTFTYATDHAMLKINLSYCSVKLSQGFHFNNLMVCLVSKEYTSRNVGDHGRKLGKSVPSRERAV